MITSPESQELPPASESGKRITTLPSVTIRFCGDSGDGMQLAGTQFTDTSAMVGNDMQTLPDFPAEIRAPAGTLVGVIRLPDSLFHPPTSSRPAMSSMRWSR